MNASRDASSHPLHAPRPAPPRVLLVIADTECRQVAVRRLRRMAPDCRVLVEADPVEAVLAATYSQPNLVLVDGALGPGVAALTRHLMHLAPLATVLSFDTPTAPRRLPGSKPWGEAQAECERWFDAFRASHAALDGPAEAEEGE